MGSVFTNPASRSAKEAAAYTAAVLDLVGSRDPLEVLQQTVSALERAREGLSAEQETRLEAPGKWSVRHVLQHLADSELVWGWRLRLVLANDRPALTGYDQDLWAERLGYDEVDADRALEDFAALRRTRRSRPPGRLDLDRVAARFGLRYGRRGSRTSRNSNFLKSASAV